MQWRRIEEYNGENGVMASGQPEEISASGENQRSCGSNNIRRGQWLERRINIQWRSYNDQYRRNGGGVASV
jgi:hypothetical protein